VVVGRHIVPQNERVKVVADESARILHPATLDRKAGNACDETIAYFGL